jgi:hypothetical protein
MHIADLFAGSSVAFSCGLFGALDQVGISLSSATDFVALRPPISLIAAGGDRSEATLEFFVIA